MSASLADLLYRCPIQERHGRHNVAVRQVCADSRKLGRGDCYVAVRGTRADGHAFIEEAVARGAVAVVCETLPDYLDAGVTFVKVRDSRHSLGWLAANYYGNPSEALQVVGVTGTNGKTTVASLLYRLFQYLGFEAGLLSTVEVLINGDRQEPTHTTPDPLSIQRLMANMVKVGCSHCFMEVSSHAVDQQRIAGIHFSGAIFTNITPEHLDYHGSFQNYLLAKQGLFNGLPASAFALANKDDRNGRVMLQNTAARRLTYSLRSVADYHARVLEKSFEGMLINFEGREVYCRLTGKFNAYNLVAVYGAARELGLPAGSLLPALSDLHPARGRFEVINLQGGAIGLVDYAHTPDALKNVLETVWEVNQANGQVISLIGCGGERDTQKRPEMARIAVQLSDTVILTSDNPRNEDPEAIIEEMRAGVPLTKQNKLLPIVNRREAIRVGARLAGRGDVFLVAGKGHETYQEILGERRFFDDREELLRAVGQTS